MFSAITLPWNERKLSLVSKYTGLIMSVRSTPFYPQIKIKGVQIKINGLQIKMSPYFNFMSRDFNLKSSYFNLNSFYFNLRVKRCRY